MAALLPTPQPEAEDGVRALAARGTEGKVCWLRGPARFGSTRPRHRTVAPWGGSVSAFHPPRQSAAGRSRVNALVAVLH